MERGATYLTFHGEGKASYSHEARKRSAGPARRVGSSPRGQRGSGPLDQDPRTTHQWGTSSWGSILAKKPSPPSLFPLALQERASALHDVKSAPSSTALYAHLWARLRRRKRRFVHTLAKPIVERLEPKDALASEDLTGSENKRRNQPLLSATSTSSGPMLAFPLCLSIRLIPRNVVAVDPHHTSQACPRDPAKRAKRSSSLPTTPTGPLFTSLDFEDRIVFPWNALA